ncbi:hypothetical protein AMK15_36030 [Streptomyces sp. MJM1172]|nr:hypothetical protein AMK15_36030 [Streptomyces sp. MJM1172]
MFDRPGSPQDTAGRALWVRPGSRVVNPGAFGGRPYRAGPGKRVRRVPRGDVVVFAVAPATAYGFGRDDGVHSPTRWTF